MCMRKAIPISMRSKNAFLKCTHIDSKIFRDEVVCNDQIETLCLDT